MRLAALTVAVSVALAAPAWAVAADFGDAPGRRPAGYPADLSVLGTFPSLAADKGPQHGRLGPHLGLSATSEGDSRQVDRDRDEGASLKVRRCGSSTLTVIIDARRLPPGAGTVYVNAWFDWNADGDWLDGRARAGCGPEWGVQNVEIDVRRFPGDRYLTVPIRFQAGALPPEFWWRVQVQAETPAAHRGGAAETPYRGGETEDYLQHTRGVGDDDQPPPAVPPPAYRCWGAGEILEHGDGSFHMFEATPTNYALTEPMEVTRLRAEILGETEGVRAVNPQTLGKDSGFVRAFSTAARKHVRNPRVQFLRFVFQFDVRVRERTFPVRVTCPYAISHTSWLAPVRALRVVGGPGQPFELPDFRVCRIDVPFPVDSARIPDNGFVNFGVAISFPKGVRFVTSPSFLVTDTATGRPPPLVYFGAKFPWRQNERRLVDERDPTRRVIDVAVQVSDFLPEAPDARRGTWEIATLYVRPAHVPTCDARELGR